MFHSKSVFRSCDTRGQNAKAVIWPLDNDWTVPIKPQFSAPSLGSVNTLHISQDLHDSLTTKLIIVYQDSEKVDLSTLLGTLLRSLPI